MKTLVLITSNYPFGKSDPFPGTELPFLEKAFDRIIIISQNSRSEQTHKIPGQVKIFRYNTSTSPAGFLKLPLLLAENRKLIKSIFQKEISFRKTTGTVLSLSMKALLLRKIIKALQLRTFIIDMLRNENITRDIVFYSYWLNTGAHAISLLDYPGSIKIARAHGSDLYEEKADAGFLPLFPLVAENLDSIFFVSEPGKKYFMEKLISGKAGLNVSRLGISGPGPLLYNSGETLFRIASCSNVIPLKRVHLIIEALELVKTGKKIHWTHFGAGSKLEDLKIRAAGLKAKNSNAEADLRGFIANEEIMDFYRQNKISLFLNTSSTEGVPVSIMEAQSFGIPVIATDVGGVSEIVTEGTGFLLPHDFKPEELAGKIEYFLNLPPAEEKKFREKAFRNWKQKFDASVNYPDFINSVNRIFETAIKENPAD